MYIMAAANVAADVEDANLAIIQNINTFKDTILGSVMTELKNNPQLLEFFKSCKPIFNIKNYNRERFDTMYDPFRKLLLASEYDGDDTHLFVLFSILYNVDLFGADETRVDTDGGWRVLQPSICLFVILDLVKEYKKMLADPNFAIIQNIIIFNQYVPFIITKRETDPRVIKYYKKIIFNPCNYKLSNFEVIKAKFESDYFHIITKPNQKYKRTFGNDELTLYALFSILYNVPAFGVTDDSINDDGFELLQVKLENEMVFIDFIVGWYKVLDGKRRMGEDINAEFEIIDNPYQNESQCNIMKKYVKTKKDVLHNNYKKYLKYKNKYLALKKQLEKNN